jgi:hypothetical protein
MTVIAIEASVENMLEEAGALAFHDGIACNGVEVSVGRICR